MQLKQCLKGNLQQSQINDPRFHLKKPEKAKKGHEYLWVNGVFFVSRGL